MLKYNKKYSFRVEIDGLSVASFKTAGPLEATTEVITEQEGGSNAEVKELGRTSFANITLTKGITDNEELWFWMKEGIDGEDASKDLAIVQTNKLGEEIKRWEVLNAIPVRFKAGDWDATASENTIEELEVAIESFDKG